MCAMYTVQEEDIIYSDLKTAISTTPDLLEGQPTEIIDTLYKLITTVGGTSKPYYHTKKDKLEKERDALDKTITADAYKDAKRKEVDIKSLNEHNANLDALERELKNTIIKTFVDDKVKSYLELEKAYKEVTGAQHIQTPMKTWFNEKSDKVIKSSNSLEEEQLKNDAIKELTNDYLDKKIEVLRTSGRIPNVTRTTIVNGNPATLTNDILAYVATNVPMPENIRAYLFAPTNTPAEEKDKEEEIRKLKETIKHINAEDLKTKAKTDIEAKVNAKKGKQTPIKEKYEKSYENLTTTFESPLNKINDEFLETTINYGRAKLNGSDAKPIEDSAPYKKVLNAMVRDRAIHIDMDYNGITYDLESAFTQIKSEADAGNISEADALKEFDEIEGYVKAITSDVKLELEDLLPSAYSYVIAHSNKDSSRRSKKEKYLRVNSEGKLTKKWEDGVYAQNGIGAILEKYVGVRTRVTVQPTLAQKGWVYLSSFGQNRAAARVEMQRVPLVDVDDLLYEIKEKHKRATWRDNKDDYIKIDEVIDAAFGLAIEENDIEDMENAWNGVRLLDSNSTISEILSAYTTAVNIGAEVNADAKRWTEVKNGEFKEMDDEINEMCGIAYSSLDKFINVSNAILSATGLKKIETEKLQVKHDINKTAIKPLKYAPLVTGGAVIGGGLALTNLLYDWATGNDTKKTPDGSPIARPWERTTELGISLLAALGVHAFTEKAIGKPHAQ